MGTPIPGPGKRDHGDVDVIVVGVKRLGGEGEMGLEGLGEVSLRILM